MAELDDMAAFPARNANGKLRFPTPECLQHRGRNNNYHIPITDSDIPFVSHAAKQPHMHLLEKRRNVLSTCIGVLDFHCTRALNFLRSIWVAGDGVDVHSPLHLGEYR